MKTNYNIEREKLHLPEYGRHIQDMIAELVAIPDRKERNLRAKALVAIMSNIQHCSSGDVPDFDRKMWDHLFIMSDFKLDVDSPYPKPTAQTIMPPPSRLSYPEGRITMKHYGRNVRNVIRSLERLRDQELVDAVVCNVARYMRTKSYEYNQEHPDNSVIIRDIRRMADFDIEVDEEAVTMIKSDYKLGHSTYQKKFVRTKKNGKIQKNGRKAGYSK